MPSSEHEMPLELIRHDPTVVAWLLHDIAGQQLPPYASVEHYPTEVRAVDPGTYHCDAVVVFRDNQQAPVLAVIVEVQRAFDDAKPATWATYLSHAELDLAVPSTLLVYCPRPAVARRYRARLATRPGSLRLDPVFITADVVPLVTDPAAAEADLAAAIMGVLAHSSDPALVAGFPAMAAVLDSLGERASAYYDLILAALSQPIRHHWEDYVTTTKPRYFSKEFNDAYNRGEAVGEARGEAQSLLLVLAARGIAVSDTTKDQILTTTDSTLLQTWLRRAVTATSLTDVLDD